MDKKGIIGWFIDNPVAANILMFFVVIGGFLWATEIKQEVFPQFTIDQVVVSVSYPGASPEEIERGIILPIEEAIEGIDGIDEVRSTAMEGVGTVIIEAQNGINMNQLYQDIKMEIDRITTFPEDAEEPSVYIPTRRRQVITLILYGNIDEKILTYWAEYIKDRLLQLKDVTSVEIEGKKDYEISVEVKRDVLKKYNITLSQIAQKIRESNLETPAGKIETRKGDILIRVSERKEHGYELKKIPIITSNFGKQLLLGDIATIKDGFEDIKRSIEYNGMPAIAIEVFRVGDQKPIELAEKVKKALDEIKKELPNGIYADIVRDRSKVFAQRIELLLRNGKLGLILVFSLLALFLEIRLAFWVMLGIPISFLGSMLIFPFFDVSINMISLFAFIICLGIVVDDAIVVGENIYRYRQMGMPFKKASYLGTKEVSIPVIFSILTNILAFLPMYFVPGVMGKIFRIIPVIVISVFLISLLESLLILPSHIAHQREDVYAFLKPINTIQQKISSFLLKFINNFYGPVLKYCIKFRYLTFTVAIMTLFIAISFVRGGHIGVIFFPKVESDFAQVNFELPVESSFFDTLKVSNILTEKAKEIIKKYGGSKLAQGIYATIEDNHGNIRVYLTDPDIRPITTGEFTKIWRENTWDLAGIKSIQFYSDFGGPGHGTSLTVELQHRDTNVLKAASNDLVSYLSKFSNVADINSGINEGNIQFDIELNDVGKALGLDANYLARQLRNTYYGYEAKRFFRGTNEVKIMVRADQQERRFENFFNTYLVSLSDGTYVPLKDIAKIKRTRSYINIDRRNFRRIVNVTANVIPEKEIQNIIQTLKTEYIPDLKKKYPGISISFEGKQSDLKESMSTLFKGLIIALIGIYVMLAIPFKSYYQPLIVMSVIPFGIIGATIGHMLLGYSLSVISMMGIVALTGVVINDSLVLIDFANRKIREENVSFQIAVYEAGKKRFRPIILTTLTTFFGLMPMIFETSVQARILIPMAVSLGFGILFSTFTVLILVPGVYVIMEDFFSLKQYFMGFIRLKLKKL